MRGKYKNISDPQRKEWFNWKINSLFTIFSSKNLNHCANHMPKIAEI